MLDIDNFKNYNNNYGRNEGDKLLTQTAYVLFRETKKCDAVSRYGGDEFAILISETNTNDILWVIERIKKSYKEMIEKKDLPEDMTLSIGYSIYPNFAKNKDDLIMQTNSALYQAKNKGKNNVQLYRDIFEEIKAFFDSDENQLFGGVRVLLSTVSAKDRYTFKHSERVMEYCEKIGKVLGLNKNRLRELKIAALLHDIGKVEIPEEVLNKSTPLSSSELLLMRNHPSYSVDILEPLSDMESLIHAIKFHHERYDGKGYPSGIRGNNIPLEARILCVADAYDAMLSDRPYRRGMEKEEALEELRDNSGTQFDPLVVDTLLNILNKRN
jgi:diguanylate cyclase (GGDEF)-like protein/putative nucleotidyltransferase with HDIG domain